MRKIIRQSWRQMRPNTKVLSKRYKPLKKQLTNWIRRKQRKVNLQPIKTRNWPNFKAFSTLKKTKCSPHIMQRRRLKRSLKMQWAINKKRMKPFRNFSRNYKTPNRNLRSQRKSFKRQSRRKLCSLPMRKPCRSSLKWMLTVIIKDHSSKINPSSCHPSTHMIRLQSKTQIDFPWKTK